MLATFGVKSTSPVPIIMSTKERSKRKGDALALADVDMDLDHVKGLLKVGLNSHGDGNMMRSAGAAEQPLREQ